MVEVVRKWAALNTPLEAWAVIRNAFRVKTNRLVLLGPVDNVVNTF